MYCPMLLLVLTIFLGTAFIFLSRASHVFKWRVGVVVVWWRCWVADVEVIRGFRPSNVDFWCSWRCSFCCDIVVILLVFCGMYRYHRTLVESPKQGGGDPASTSGSGSSQWRLLYYIYVHIPYLTKRCCTPFLLSGQARKTVKNHSRPNPRLKRT